VSMDIFEETLVRELAAAQLPYDEALAWQRRTDN